LKFAPLSAFLALAAPSSAMAQMAVSTFGANDAQLCYQAAADDFASDTADCDKALQGGALTARDRIATRVNRGIIYNREGKLDAALEDFNKAIEKNGELAEAFLNRGNTFYLMRRYDEAIEDYRTSLQFNLKQSHVAWYNIGLALEAKKDDVQAKEAYRTALEINPEFGPARKKLGLSGAPAQE